MSQRFMDYSLLLAIKKVVREEEDSFLNITGEMFDQDMDIENSPENA